MNIKKELTKGSSALLVLSVLEKGDMYGYRIIKEIEMRSEFVFSLKEGTLYPILHAFEKDGYVVENIIINTKTSGSGWTECVSLENIGVILKKQKIKQKTL